MIDFTVEPLANAPGCSYYLVIELRGRIVAIVEGESPSEAMGLLDAVRPLVGIAPKADVVLAPVEVCPPDVPVFTAVYLRALRDRAMRESQLPGATRH